MAAIVFQKPQKSISCPQRKSTLSLHYSYNLVDCLNLEDKFNSNIAKYQREKVTHENRVYIRGDTTCRM